MDLSRFYGKAEPVKGRRLLHIDSSPRTHGSYTRMLSREFVEAWLAAHRDDSVDYLDLVEHPAPHVGQATAELLHTGATPKGSLAPADLAAIEQTNALVAQFEGADVYVIGAPMYFAHVPSTLKAYLDHLPYFGRTVALTEAGPQGLLKGKQAVFVTARGFDYTAGSPMAPFDLQEPWLRNAFAFIGITDVAFINLNCLDLGESAIHHALDAARAEILDLVTNGIQAKGAGVNSAGQEQPQHPG